MSEQTNPMREIISKCWTDEAFKKQLMGDPVATLRAEGVQVPDGVIVNVVENTANSFTLVIPVRPAELSDEQLQDVNGGCTLPDGLHPYTPDPPAFVV